MAKKPFIFVLLALVWPAVKAINSASWLDIINQSFLAGIICLLAAAVFLILKTGFLSLFLEGFSKVGSFISPKSRAMEREDERARDDESLAEFKGGLLQNLLGVFSMVGFSSLAFSVLALLFYY